MQAPQHFDNPIESPNFMPTYLSGTNSGKSSIVQRKTFRQERSEVVCHHRYAEPAAIMLAAAEAAHSFSSYGGVGHRLG